MIRKILAYGHPMLSTTCEDINIPYPKIKELQNDLWDTMQNANGCGLAAPQIGIPLNVFIVDSRSTYELLDEETRAIYFDGDEGIKDTFINARIIDSSEDFWEDDEGCLSIPGITAEITRPWSITISYLNHQLESVTRKFSGMTARMIQHELDHTRGILLLHYLKPFQRKLMENKLKRVQRGNIKTTYSMLFSNK
jgi:peptide deformylase